MSEVQSIEQPVEQSSGSIENSQPQQSLNDQSASKQPGLPDLDKMDRFTFNGREMTLKDLKSAYMAHSDYTKKTQALANERKFIDNLESDLDMVKNNPSLAEQFKSVYPQAYHRYLKYAAGEAQTQQQRPGVEANPEITSLKSQLQEIREFQDSIKIKELESQFSTIFNDSIKAKYKWVDEDNLVGLAREAVQAGYQLRDANGKIDRNVLEQIARGENERLEKKFQEYQKGIVDKQRVANKSARDVGAGGGIAGAAPKKMSWGDATKEFERRLSRSDT